MVVVLPFPHVADKTFIEKTKENKTFRMEGLVFFTVTPSLSALLLENGSDTVENGLVLVQMS